MAGRGDVLCFGGTKNGMAVSKAVIFFKAELAIDFDYRRKQAGQLASKMRFLSAPWESMLKSGAWLRNAAHANKFAVFFARNVEHLPGLELVFPVQANGVFLNLSEDVQHFHRRRGPLHVLLGYGPRESCRVDFRSPSRNFACCCLGPEST